MPEIVTRGDWDQQPRFWMEWSITVQEDEDEYNQAVDSGEFKGWSREEDHQRWSSIRLDFTAPAGTPDGLHTVYHIAGYQDPQVGASAGLIVRDGKFEPHSTQAAVLEAVCKSYGITADAVRTGREGIDHVFIEDFVWNPERRALEVQTGS